MSQRPPFFVVGCPRSGTTLLRNLLRSHPNLAIPPESHFIPILYRALGEPTDERSRRRIVSRVLNVHWVRSWRLEASVSDFDGCRSFAEIVERLYRLQSGANGRMGDKTPGYARTIPTLDAIFPDAQFIHIIRDGRDVALSLSRVWFGHRHAYSAARYWQDHVSRARRDGPPLGPRRYLEIRYEDLLRDTEGIMRRVCGFLGEPYDPRVLVPAPDRRRSPVRPRHRRSMRMVSDSAIVPSNSGKWRTEMSRRELEVFETVAGDLLSELGYERVTSGCAIGRTRRIYWTLDDVIRRGAGFWSRRRKRSWIPSEARLLWSRVRGRE